MKTPEDLVSFVGSYDRDGLAERSENGELTVRDQVTLLQMAVTEALTELVLSGEDQNRGVNGEAVARAIMLVVSAAPMEERGVIYGRLGLDGLAKPDTPIQDS